MKYSLPLFILLLFIPVIFFIGSGCANIVPPSGGPMDTIPPKLVRVNPPDSTRGFENRTITFTFDEYIDPQLDITGNLLISPTPSVQPRLEVKLNTVTIRIKDTLEPNTTYYYQLGKVIKDVNERNVLQDLSYIFTTGNTIDSLELSGKVLLAETGKADSTLIVLLHRSSVDSAVIKEKPRYIARLDNNGNFQFRYLAPGTYYIYALKDEAGTRTYTSSSQLFAFYDSAIDVATQTSPITLYAYAEKKEQPPAPTISFSGNRGPGRNDERRLRFTTSLTNNMQDLLSSLTLNFDQPLQNLDTTKMHLSTDSAFNTIRNYSWEMDSLNKKLSLKIDWRENTLYNLVLEKEFAEDSSGRQLLKDDTVSFLTKKNSDYGTLKMSFANLDLSQNPVIQFVQNDQVVKSFPLISANLYQSLFPPGEYDLNVLYDKNKNGHWDPGNFFNGKIQPELVNPLDRKINIRPNWDNEFDINL